MSEGVNQCAVNELFEYSKNVEYLIERINNTCIITAKFRNFGVTCAESEHSCWMLDAIDIYETYMNYAQFNIQKCVENVSVETLNALAYKLAEINEEKIRKLIKSFYDN
jgi:hypothetical protein